MSEKEKFFESIKSFLDASVFKEIYSNDDFVIFNASDSCYIFFDYEFSNQMPKPQAFNLPPGWLEPVMIDNEAFYRWIDTLKEDELKNHVVVCSEKMLEFLKEQKQKCDSEGPLVDLELEQRLMEIYDGKQNKVRKLWRKRKLWKR